MSETITEHEAAEEPVIEPAAEAVSDEQLVAMLVDRARSEGLQLVRKRQRCLTGVELVLSLSAKGLTHGEISAHLAEVYGAEVSKPSISTNTDKVMEGMAEWQSRPLDRGRIPSVRIFRVVTDRVTAGGG